MTVQLYPGRSVEQKRALVAAITQALVDHAGARPDALHVILQEVAPENWGLAGSLGIDRIQARDAGEPIQPGHIAHVALVVRDLPAARKFYCDLLGLGVRSEGAFRDGRPLLVTTGGVGLIEDKQHDDAAVDHIALEVGDLDGLRVQLTKANVPIVRGPEPSSYGTSLYVRDPDENVIELIEGGGES